MASPLSLQNPLLPSFRPLTSSAFPFHSHTWSTPRNHRLTISSSASASPLHADHIVVGCGSACLDYLAAVTSYPKPDDKIRSTSFKVQGGGNAGNALTCAARLGLNPRLITKVANDSQGNAILDELQADGVDTSCVVVSQEGNSPFTYIIVDNQTQTRTCIHTPGDPPMVPEDLTESNLFSALSEARLVYFDGRLHETALVIGEEAKRRGIPILVDAERKREGLDSLLDLSSYVVCSTSFPQSKTWGLCRCLMEANEFKFVTQFSLPIRPITEVHIGNLGIHLPVSSFYACDLPVVVKRGYRTLQTSKAFTDAPSVPSALVSMLLKLPNIKFVIVTLGEEGCIMLERSSTEELLSEEIEVDGLLEKLKQEKDNTATAPTCISSSASMLRADGIGTIGGRLFVGTAEKIPSSELVDTTGAGDAFIGAVLYAICANMPPEKLLPFAAQVAALGCRALGARSGLPYHDDLRLASFLR